jgi:MEMO1 family protein
MKGKERMSQVRKPAVAGYFYPAEASKLKNEIELLLSIASGDKIDSRIFGIVSPHAGYIYSGKTAAFGYNQLDKDKIRKVIILSPSHREYFPGTSVYSGDAYQTPLGTVQVNKEIADNLIVNAKTIFKGVKGHKEEHAVEVQIPFLQTVLNDFEIIPVVIGDQGKLYVDELSEKLAEVMDDETIIVSSSDLSHYYSRAVADKLDSIVEKDINDFNYSELQENFEAKKCEACGAGTIIAMMKSANKLNFRKSKVLHRSNSGDTTGDNNEVVGYLSAVVYGD